MKRFFSEHVSQLVRHQSLILKQGFVLVVFSSKNMLASGSQLDSRESHRQSSEEDLYFLLTFSIVTPCPNSNFTLVQRCLQSLGTLKLDCQYFTIFSPGFASEMKEKALTLRSIFLGVVYQSKHAFGIDQLLFQEQLPFGKDQAETSFLSFSN